VQLDQMEGRRDGPTCARCRGSSPCLGQVRRRGEGGAVTGDNGVGVDADWRPSARRRHRSLARQRWSHPNRGGRVAGDVASSSSQVDGSGSARVPEGRHPPPHSSTRSVRGGARRWPSWRPYRTSSAWPNECRQRGWPDPGRPRRRERAVLPSLTRLPVVCRWPGGPRRHLEFDSSHLCSEST